MDSNKQKRIFIYSIQHTGTHFIRDLIETFSSPDKILRAGKIMKTLPVKREQHTPEKWIEISCTVNSKKEIQQANLIIFSCHHMNPDTKMIKSIIKTKPPIPFVIPIRDPLLTANTFLFWYNKFNNNSDWRLRHIKKIAKLYTEMLSIPKTHCFVFPVDLYNTDTKYQKINHSKNLFKFCKLNWSDKTQKFIDKWEPAHKTQNISKAIRILKFKDNKTAISNKDINTLLKTMNPEITYLQKQKKLKEKLAEYGYKDLVWW